jgi:hypothetical protein
LQLELKLRFVVQLTIFKATFCHLKKVKPSEVWIPRLFSTTTFDLQRSLLVFTMKINVKLAMQKPFDINPLTKLWKTFFNLGFLNKNP